ncbi:general stress protein [Ktedonosporobacter rubrisoli]|uniref:General stress protein n=1 Tax=Ktedonosporobacter rubrisoli TaxID=2509675 RepID=A0A4P6JNL2_KTERU|nr:pyridoxamine 5'-phosphate oxidase family protein [Ktedonosporobacter rubrisoli]QBD76700.1 general stress protein [Ktedonosporobacter rubrisoli]
MTHHTNSKDDRKLLQEKIKGIRFAMLTTQEADGVLRSRPMVTQDADFTGDLWFFTYTDSPKVNQIEQNRQVNVSYMRSDDMTFVSVSGTAQLVQDRKKIKEYWKSTYKAWFPNGEDDPNLALLKVHVDSAEYWDAPAGKMSGLYAAIKGITGKPQDIGEDVKLDMR